MAMAMVCGCQVLPQRYYGFIGALPLPLPWRDKVSFPASRTLYQQNPSSLLSASFARQAILALSIENAETSEADKKPVDTENCASQKELPYENILAVLGNAPLLEVLQESDHNIEGSGDASGWVPNDHVLSCCETQRKLRVAVLLSGGVDSSVALRLLCAAGHSCTAFYLKIWFQDDFENFWSACPWEEDLKYAQEVCDEVGLKLEVVHLTEVYWSTVVAKCISEVQAGRTPNPDVLCNSTIKFGAFLDQIDRTKFDCVASGHYARVERLYDKHGKLQSTLKLSKDELKDQTYFLSQLSQDQLGYLTFPLGGLTKVEVRQLAQAMKLPNKDRKDSQGICFLGKVKFNEFIARHLGEKEGYLVEAETGTVMGKHRGFWFFTIGQRRGISLSHGPWYVVAKDAEKNLVFISNNYFSGEKQRRNFHVNNLNWFLRRPDNASQLKCKVRHGPKFHDCRLEYQQGGVFVRLQEDDQALAPGQYAAFYEGDTCLGSGVITNFLDGLESCTVSPQALEDGRIGVIQEVKNAASCAQKQVRANILGTLLSKLGKWIQCFAASQRSST